MEKTDTLPTILVIFGATGDLVSRKLIPALFSLYEQQRLPSLFQVVGVARTEHTPEEFQAYVRDVLTGHGRKDSEVEKFSSLFTYTAGDFTKEDSYRVLAQKLGKQDDQWRVCANKLFYLAVPPQMYGGIFDKLASSGLTDPCSPEEGWTRVIVEKPFGKDLQTAQELDEKLGKLFREEQVYRIDHYLGKDTVQNILAFRFSNAFLQPAWDAQSIERIHISFFEELGIEGRVGFYDSIGALRDVGQNHMLQLLALFTMESPESFTADAIREKRADVLGALEAMDQKDIAQYTVRGQYDGYTEPDGVSDDSRTETYFKIQTRLNTAQWHGVPITLESGKAMGESKVEVTITFRHQMPCLCPPKKHYTNVLRYMVQPNEGATMSFWVKKPGSEMVIEEKAFSFNYKDAFDGEEFINAYAKLLSDAIAGDQTLFVSTDEILASWKFVDPIVRGWQDDIVPLHAYAQGSEGPDVTRNAQDIPSKEIGYIGLGKMGANMAERLLDFDWDVVATDPDADAQAAIKEKGARVAESAAAVVQSLATPRLVWLMVPHQVVDDVLEEIMPHLEAGDTVIDGGNSLYKESIRRSEALEEKGIQYLDVGVSGGPSGARRGACLMVGGDRAVYKQHVGLFSDLAVPGGYDYMGKCGAGHFVKMVHNGIEYGMMQAIGEGFSVMKEWSNDFDLGHIARLYNHGSVIESALVGWLKDAYTMDGDTLEDISGKVSHSGEGQWTVEAAKELGIPVPIIQGALQFRIESQENPSYTGQVVSALRNQFGGHSVAKEE